MEKQRVLRMIDLVFRAKNLWNSGKGKVDHVRLEISNDGWVHVNVYEDVANSDNSITYTTRNLFAHGKHWIYDPSLEKAEEHILRLLKEKED